MFGVGEGRAPVLKDQLDDVADAFLSADCHGDVHRLSGS